MDKLLIDGDVVAFKVASACEQRSVLVTHVPTSRTKSFKHRTEFKGWLSENSKWNESEFTIEDVQECEPEAFAFNTINQMVKNIKQKCGIEKASFFLSGKDNFRRSLPLPVQYKDSRKETIKPLLLQACRDFIEGKFKAVIVNGEEADDRLAREAHQAFLRGEKWVQVTSDKDAEQVEGWIFNLDKDEAPRLIDAFGNLYRDDKGKVRGGGYLYLCFQWINGDSTDCYCPSDMVRLSNPKWKFGEVGVYNLLKDVATVEEADAVVDKWYTDMFPEPVTYEAWNGEEYTKSAKEIQKMYFDCAYMRKDTHGN